MNKTTKKVATPLALASAIGLALSGATLAQSQPDRPPFPAPPGQVDKIVATAATPELLEAQLGPEGTLGEPVELLRTSFNLRANNQRDLLIRLDGECASWINAEAAEEEPEDPEDPEEPGDPDEPGDPEDPGEGTDQPAEDNPGVVGASVLAWVELNGEPVSVSSGQSMDIEFADDGTVVFCNSDRELSFEETDDEALYDAFLAARSTGGFTWTVPGADRGSHEIVVKAVIDIHAETDDAEDNGNGEDNGNDNGNGNGEEVGNEEEFRVDAFAVFGKRSLIVEPTRLAVSDPMTEAEL